MPSKPSLLNPLRRLVGLPEEFTLVAHQECMNCGKEIPKKSKTAVLVTLRRNDSEPYGWYSFCTEECYDKYLREFFPELWYSKQAIGRIGVCRKC